MRKAARAIIIYNQNILLMKRNKFGSEYYCLPGGGIDMGETADHAVVREIKEEASITVANPRLVYIESAGPLYGTQYHFVCDYQDGEVKIHPDSIEAKLNAGGQNMFYILWVPISKFAGLEFRSSVLQQELLTAFRDGFPKQPKQLSSQAEISYTTKTKQEE
ncbi:MAG: NUDIX domain-containing protein [Candidatus Saccharimonadales bacterium]